MPKKIVLAAVTMLAALAITVQADVHLPNVFSEHMVLQRQSPIPVWGWADPGETVTVQLADSAQKEAVADAQGEWRVALDAAEAGGPFTFSVSGNTAVVFTNVYIGEVWLCSGQSNMQWPVSRSVSPDEEVANANWPLIRHLEVPRRPATMPQDDQGSTWQVCSPATAGNFTAVGYFFGRTLHQELKVPIGLINASWGGTRIEPWTPPVGFASTPAVKHIADELSTKDPSSSIYQSKLDNHLNAVESWVAAARANLTKGVPPGPAPAFPGELTPYKSHQSPAMLYNGMLNPVVPYAIRGSIWYQGEANHQEGMLYYEKTKALVNGWRTAWNLPELPYYFVQIAPFKYGNEEPTVLAEFWEAQTKALDIPHTGQVVIHDIGNINNIHPKNKQEVGRRLALIALAKDYGRDDVVYSGPVFKSLDVEAGQLRVHFNHVGSGLVARGGKPLDHFEIIGKGTGWQSATATVHEASVVLASTNVPAPTAVRFAWHKLAEPNLANAEGLPACPFRAGEVPSTDMLAMNVDEAGAYQLVYDADLAKLRADPIEYTEDRTAEVSGPFKRVAYFLELGKEAGSVDQYLYVSMDAFTDDPKQLGIPNFASQISHQKGVTNLKVISNVGSVTTGDAFANGHLEFWPNNYDPANEKQVPGASPAVFDIGDRMTAPVNGHGCMQVHNLDTKQTLFAINRFRSGENASMGIGNSPGHTKDWTHTDTGKQYKHKRLRILVKH
ncbi:MAG: 9-O-acetylesterase [Verrucomicrobia bacterium]|jgi:sialate O-acetylesterase|nr:9-O-acetylesterase [Verrucomicrobiota bacterium]